MTEGNSTPALDLEHLLKRLESSRAVLMDALDACEPDRFESGSGEGDSIRTILERTGDEINFYYGRLTARALSLPQPPCMQKSDFLSLREAKISLQVSHRRFTNLLHDVLPADLERTAHDDNNAGTYTLRQVLEMAAAQYRLRAAQVQRIASETPGRAR